MKLIKWLSLVALTLVILAAGIAFLQPTNYRVERSTIVQVPPAQAFAQVIELKNWLSWSPWAERDPDMVIDYSSPSSGQGAFNTWQSQTEGSGQLTIENVETNKHIRCKLDFKEPWEGQAYTDFHFEATNDEATETKITWSMDGTNKNLIEKFFYFAMNMPEMLGKDYEKGLSKLKMVLMN